MYVYQHWDWTDVKAREYPCNSKEFPIGSVIYYIDNCAIGCDTTQNLKEFRDRQAYRKHINFGIVTDQYPNIICLQPLVITDVRLINSMPYKDFVNKHLPTDYMKLPKGWTYQTDLYELTLHRTLNKKLKEQLSEYHADFYKYPETVLELYNKGLLINIQDKCNADIDVEIDPKLGYRLKAVYDTAYRPCSISLKTDRAFYTYEEAFAALNEYCDELKRQSALTDYEWAVEQIDLLLAHHHCSEERKEYYRTWLLSLENLEDVDVRTRLGGIEWKYSKNRTWHTIE